MHVRSGKDRRNPENLRRSTDVETFMNCPKYNYHELTSLQIEEIAEKAAIKAVAKINSERDIEFAQFVKKVGFNWGEKILFALGIFMLWLLGWATNHGFKL